MALSFLLDEHMRHRLASALNQHNTRGLDTIDFNQVGEPEDLPLGSLDPDIVSWAEREGRILISFDRSTLPDVLALHLDSGRHSPGVFLLRPHRQLPEVVEFLALVAHHSEAWEWWDRAVYIPFD